MIDKKTASKLFFVAAFPLILAGCDEDKVQKETKRNEATERHNIERLVAPMEVLKLMEDGVYSLTIDVKGAPKDCIASVNQGWGGVKSVTFDCN